MDNLKPCPFCGGEARLSPATSVGVHMSICCDNCAFSISEFYIDDCIATWNTRATHTVQEAAKVLLDGSLADLSIEMMRHHKRTKDSGHGGYMPSMRYALRAIAGEGE